MPGEAEKRAAAARDEAVSAIVALIKTSGLAAAIAAVSDALAPAAEARQAERFGRIQPDKPKAFIFDGIPGPEFDHLRVRRRANGALTVIAEPYGLAFSDLKRIVEFCDANGLSACIAPCGTKTPVTSMQVIYEPKSENQRRPYGMNSWLEEP